MSCGVDIGEISIERILGSRWFLVGKDDVYGLSQNDDRELPEHGAFGYRI